MCRVSSSRFSLLWTPPALGRDFTEADDRAGADGVVLLSDEVWQLRYNAERAIIGRSISINALRNEWRLGYHRRQGAAPPPVSPGH